MNALRIGTRNSPMALAQANYVRELLEKAGEAVEVVGMTTSADVWQGSLAQLGGKANFTKEIDDALVNNRVDIAVHCMKDVPGDVPLPAGTAFAAYLTRDDVRDVLVSRDDVAFDDLPSGARVGTSAVRRRAQLLAIRPDLQIRPIRGNVNSRLAKLDSGDYDALVLARAGLTRLDMVERVATTFDADEMLPAVGAGVLGIQVRSNDPSATAAVAALSDPVTAACVTAERAMLASLSGHCNSPIAGWATHTNATLTLRGAVFALDGSSIVRSEIVGDHPEHVGAAAAAELLAGGAGALIDASRYPG